MTIRARGTCLYYPALCESWFGDWPTDPALLLFWLNKHLLLGGMSVFASTWEIERDFGGGWASNEESGEADDASTEKRSPGGGGVEDRSSHAGSSGSDAQQPEKASDVGFFQGMFR